MEHGTISSHASQLEKLVLDALQDMQPSGSPPFSSRRPDQRQLEFPPSDN